MKYRIIEVSGRYSIDYTQVPHKEVYIPYYGLEYKPDWWPFWFREYTDSDIDGLKKVARNHHRAHVFKKKVVVSGTIEDILAFGGNNE